MYHTQPRTLPSHKPPAEQRQNLVQCAEHITATATASALLFSGTTPLSKYTAYTSTCMKLCSSAVAAATGCHAHGSHVRSARSAKQVAAAAGGRRRGIRILCWRGAHKPLDDGDAGEHAVQALRKGRCLRLRLHTARGCKSSVRVCRN